jgi:hypothetical protein
MLRLPESAQPIPAGRGIRAQPRTDIDREHDAPIRSPRQRPRHQRPAQPLRLHPSLTQCVISHRDRGGAQPPASARPANRPARPRTAPPQPARTARPPAPSTTRRTPAEISRDHPSRPGWQSVQLSGHTPHSPSRPPLSSSSSVRGTRRGSSGGRTMRRRHAGRRQQANPHSPQPVKEQADSRCRSPPPMISIEGFRRAGGRHAAVGGRAGHPGWRHGRQSSPAVSDFRVLSQEWNGSSSCCAACSGSPAARPASASAARRCGRPVSC